jgi:hypothetical protein
MVERAASAVTRPGPWAERRRWLAHRNLALRVTRVLVVTAFVLLALVLGSAVGRLGQEERHVRPVAPTAQSLSPRRPAAGVDPRQRASPAGRRL